MTVFLMTSGSLYGLNTPTFDSNSVSQLNGVVSVSWSSVNDVSGYHLEWTYENSYDKNQPSTAQDDIQKFFREGATRIETTGLTYSIPAIYENGWLHIRVRAFKKTDEGGIVVSNWSSSISATVFADSKDKMNWQAVVNYAEEGKNKEVMTYYDGTSRARQSVTRNSSNNDIIVGETYYDYQGRPAVQALPVPSMVGGDTISYHYDFNKEEVTDSTFDKRYFDKSSGENTCGIATKKMSTSSGSAKYYSSGNDDRSGFNKYIPDAEGYPFSQTEYTPDNTGRIRRQGGVGAQYQLSGTNVHPTQYYYGKPAQEDLWRLFGSQCGDFSHYQKNMIQDPNGSIQVSYVDMHGRTVATAMAGRKPETLTELESNNSVEKTINLVDYPSVPKGEIAYLSTFEYLSSSAGTNNFNYQMKVSGETVRDFCMECDYVLRLEIRDDCGELLPLINVQSDEQVENGSTSIVIPMKGGQFQNCGSEITYNIIFSAQMKVGNYHISRFIQVDQETQRKEVERFLSSENVKTLYDFVDDEIQATDFTQCHVPTCNETCMKENPTSYADYIDCMAECMNEDTVNSCTAIRERLIDDLAPGMILSNEYSFEDEDEEHGSVNLPDQQSTGGQYAIYTITTNGEGQEEYGGVDHTIFVENILNGILSDAGFKEVVEKSGYEWDEIFGSVQGTSDKIKSFVTHFDRSWAEYLAPKYHPEWPLLADCEATRQMQAYELKMRMVETFDEAMKLSLLNDLKTNGDKFFVKNKEFASALNRYFVDKENNAYSIWQTAIAMALSSDTTNKDISISSIIADFPSSRYESNGCPKQYKVGDKYYNIDWDRVWQYYRSLYLAKRRTIFDITQKNGKQRNNILLGGDEHAKFAELGKEERIPDAYTEMQNKLSDGVNCILDGDGNVKEDAKMANKTKIWKSCLNQANAQISTVVYDLRDCFKGNLSAADSIAMCNDLVKIMALSAYRSGNLLGYSSIPTDSCYYNRNLDPEEIELYLPNQDINTFEKVLNAYVSKGLVLSEDCNAYLITSLSEYGNDNAIETENPLDACGCELIEQMAVEFENQNNLPINIQSASAYFRDKTGVQIDNFNAKLCACRKVKETYGSWTSENAVAALKNSGYTVPASIICDECVSCDIVSSAITAYKLNTRVFETLSSFVNFNLSSFAEQTLINYKKSIANYLNQKFNMNKSFEDYLDFASKCEGVSSHNLSYTECSQTLASQQLVLFLNKLNKDHRLVGTIRDSRLYTEIQKMMVLRDQTLTGFTPTDVPVQNPYGYDITDEHNNISDERECTGECAIVRFDVRDTVTERTKIHITSDNQTYTIQLQSKDSARVEDIVWVESSYLDSTGVLYLVATVVEDNKFKLDTFKVTSNHWKFADCSTVSSVNELSLCKKDKILPQTEVNECEEQLLRNIYYTAQSMYDKYIDTLRTSVIDEYLSKCLNKTKQEQYTMTYQESEHHYTLYYYDQAGNLVRTVPPAGVQFVNVNNADTLNQLKADLANGTQNIFTKHRLETRYVYNSLNQLIYQYMPDHDGFLDISSDGNTLSSSTSVQSSSYGGAEGISIVNDPEEKETSLVYLSNDNGSSWSAIDKDLDRDDIYAIHILPNGMQYVAGANGYMLQKNTATSSWTDVHTGLQKDIISIQGVNNLTLFTSDGSIYTQNGVAWNLTASSNVGTLHSVALGARIAVGEKNGVGAIYTRSNSSWSVLSADNIISDEITILEMDGNTGCAIDKTGVILKTTDGGSSWFYAGSTTASYVDLCYVGGVLYALTDDNKVVKLNKPSQVDYTNVSMIASDGKNLFYISDGNLYRNNIELTTGLKDVADFVVLQTSSSSVPSYVVYYVKNNGKLYKREITGKLMADNTIKYVSNESHKLDNCDKLALYDGAIYTCHKNKIECVNSDDVTASFSYELTEKPSLWNVNKYGFVTTKDNQISTINSGESSSSKSYIKIPVLNDVSVSSGQIVAVGNGGVVLYSNDYTTFKLLPSATTENLLCASMYAPSSNGRMIAVGGQNGTALIISKDAICPFDIKINENISAVSLFGGTLFFGTEQGHVGYWDVKDQTSYGWGSVPANAKVNVIYANDSKVWFAGDNGMIYDGTYGD